MRVCRQWYYQLHRPMGTHIHTTPTTAHPESMPKQVILGLVDLVVGVGVARVVLFGGYLVVVYLVVVSRVAENM